jgi:3-isopropylmalate/(R)-2-methylmalate dehydratase small subunit
MTPFTTVRGIAAPLPTANIDTDVIMPKQFLKRIDREGLAEGAFHDLRFDENGVPREDFILNREPYSNARFLVCGTNFGCGSSREYAVWGLSQLGIRAILAPSFGGIFFGNCEKNGLLAIELSETDIAQLESLASAPETAELAPSEGFFVEPR